MSTEIERHTHTNEIAYFVEVRCQNAIVEFDGQHWGEQWRRYYPSRSCLPASELYRMAHLYHYMTWEEANAIAWMVRHWGRAFVGSVNRFGLEARIVEVAMTYNFAATRTREIEMSIEKPKEAPCPK